MGDQKDRLNDIINKGNTPLTVGVAWSIFGITLCPCPVCLLGSLSFLTLGIADKFGFIQSLKLKMQNEKHQAHCDCDDAKR